MKTGYRNSTSVTRKVCLARLSPKTIQVYVTVIAAIKLSGYLNKEDK